MQSWSFSYLRAAIFEFLKEVFHVLNIPGKWYREHHKKPVVIPLIKSASAILLV